jgi:hypothetical protein
MKKTSVALRNSMLRMGNERGDVARTFLVEESLFGIIDRRFQFREITFDSGSGAELYAFDQHGTIRGKGDHPCAA